MNFKHIIVCLLAQASLAVAQSPESKLPPLPPGPILANPEYAQWQTVVTSEPSSNTSAANTSKTVTSVIKTKNLRLEVIDNPTIGKVTKWCDGDLQIVSTAKEPGPTLYTSPDPDPAHNFFQSYAKSPFPEIAWVSPKSYTGIQKFEGRDCMVFEAKSPSESTSSIAFISIETHLPVCLKKASEVRRYQFSPNPTSMQDFPANIKSIYQMYKQQQKTSTAEPARS